MINVNKLGLEPKNIEAEKYERIDINITISFWKRIRDMIPQQNKA